MSNAPGKPVSFSRPKVGYFSNRQRIWINQRQLTFLDTVAMGLTKDMQTYKSINLVQHLFLKT